MKKSILFRLNKRSNWPDNNINCITAENPITLKQLEYELSLNHLSPHDIDGDWENNWDSFEIFLPKGAVSKRKYAEAS